jgi:type IV secretion system protein VirB9
MIGLIGSVAGCCARRIPLAIFVAYCTYSLGQAVAQAQPSPPTLRADPRIRVVPYRADAVYRLRGYVGYQIDITFAPDERFAGLGVGDSKGVTIAADGNHLFLKPRAAHVATNLTVLTNRRTYLFDYEADPQPPDPGGADVIYAFRFEYPATPASAAFRRRSRVATDIAAAQADRPRNYDYWYCGDPPLKPVAAWDDGVRTTLVFGAHAELPAIFAVGEDGSESLVNFDVEGGRIVVQRVARRLLVRRGKLAGCIVDRAFTGGGDRLSSGTIAPNVERVRRGAAGRIEP